MLIYAEAALPVIAAILVSMAPPAGPVLLMPEPARFRRPGWLRWPRRERETFEEATAVEWLMEVSRPDEDLLIGVNSNGRPVKARLPARKPPWEDAPPPSKAGMTMVPRTSEGPPQPLPDPQPWLPGDDDPPTLVRGIRVILDKDLGQYLDQMPGYRQD